MSVNDKPHPHPYNVYLSDEQADMLEETATKTGLSKSEIFRRGIELACPEFLAWLSKHPDPKKRG